MQARRTAKGYGGQDRVSVRTFERRMETRRAEVLHSDDLKRYHATNQRIKASNLSDGRVDTKRRMQRFKQQNAELQMGYILEAQGREEEQRRIIREQDEALSAALYDMKSSKLAEETNVRRICDESEELIELQNKLKAAQMNKVRATQLKERDLIDQQEHNRDRQLDIAMEEDRQRANKREQEESQRKLYLNYESKSVLQEQMRERQKAKQEAYEAFLREKAMVDAVVAGIEAEDREKLEYQKAKQKQLQHNIRTYLAEREEWREEERKRAREELRRIQEYNALQQERHQEMLRKKKQRADVQDEVLKKLTREIEEKRKEEEEMQKLLYELYQEEAEQKAEEEIRARTDKQKRMRDDMIEANEYQKQLRAQRAAEQRVEEEEFRLKMMKKFETDRRLEQMNAQRRRREMMEYKREVETLIQERRKMYERAVEKELDERKQQAGQEDYRKAVIERERLRLLKEHASELRGYLPKGVFNSRADYEAVYGPGSWERNDENNQPKGGFQDPYYLNQQRQRPAEPIARGILPGINQNRNRQQIDSGRGGDRVSRSGGGSRSGSRSSRRDERTGLW